MRIASILLGLLMITGCSESEKTLRGYSGNIGEVVVVCSDETWEGPIGTAMKTHFADIIYGLPQDEASFNLIHFKKSSFSSIIQGQRNIVYITVDPKLTESSYQVLKNKFARGQLFLDLRSMHQDSLSAFIEEKGAEMAQKFNDIELNRLYLRNKKFGSKELSKRILDSMQIELVLQKDMYIEKLAQNKTWLRIERERTKGGFKHQISQGVFVFTKAYRAREDFTEQNLIEFCDSMLMANLPGPSEGSYMQIAKEPIEARSSEINYRGSYGREFRGLWYMKNNFMGGGFIYLACLDEKRDRVVGAFGYVFAPGFDKREYVREVEAIVKSLKFQE